MLAIVPAEALSLLDRWHDDQPVAITASGLAALNTAEAFPAAELTPCCPLCASPVGVVYRHVGGRGDQPYVSCDNFHCGFLRRA